MASVNFGSTSASYMTSPYKEFECGIHDLKYKGFSPGCPLCDSERQTKRMKESIYKLSNEVEHLTQENRKLAVQVDMVASIRDAIPLLDESDTEFLKMAFYQWRDSKNVNLKPRKRIRSGQADRTAGFMVIPRRGDPYVHDCSSVGGMAIAEYLDEAINTYGQPKAMEIMTRALSPILPGSIVGGDPS